MRGRKPLIPNVIPMRPDAAVDGEAREKELKREAKRKARKLMPKGLNERLQKEWLFGGNSSRIRGWTGSNEGR